LGYNARMALHLVIGNKNYSSWSFRPWLAMKVGGIAFGETVISLEAKDFKARVTAVSGAGRVPVLIELKPSAHRDALQLHMQARGIQCQVHYPVPPHRQPAYPELHGLSLPLTERLHHEVLSLPIGPTLNEEAIDRVIDACRTFVCPA